MENKNWWVLGSVVFFITAVMMFSLDSYTRYSGMEKHFRSKNKSFKKLKGIENDSSMGYGYSTILCEYKINGLTIHLPYSVMEHIAKGELNWTLHHSFLGANMFYEYGENELSLHAMAPPHLPRDGTYFFCSASPETEKVRISISPANNPYKSQTTQIIYTDQERKILEKDMDYARPEWQVEKLRGDIDNLEVIELDEKTYKYGILPDLEVSLKFNYEQQSHSKKDPIFWRTTTPFIDTPENRELLWQAYEELIQAFENRDEKKLASLLERAMGQSELMMGNLDNMILIENLVQKIRRNWKQYGFDKGKVIREDYVLDIADHGKLFRYVKGNHRIFQPVHFKLPDGNYYIYTFYFTMIEGKPTVAFIHNASF